MQKSRMFHRTASPSAKESLTFEDLPQDRIYECTGEQIDVPSPNVMEDKVEVASLTTQERSQQSTVKEIVEILVPQIQEQSFGLIKVIPQERVSVRIVEQTVDLPVPLIMEEIVAVDAHASNPGAE